MGSKIIKAARYDIANDSYSLQNVCRNIYGDPIQVKYFEDAHGVSYFLSLHQRYFLIFIIETTQFGTLEASMLKSISIPENEFTGNCLEIALTGTCKIYLRDDSNAYEITLDAETENKSLSDHCIHLNTSLVELVLTILSRQDINRSDFLPLINNLSHTDKCTDFELALSILDEYKSSVDTYALRSIFSANLRKNIGNIKFSGEFLKEITDFELISSLKSDSQVLSQQTAKLYF